MQTQKEPIPSRAEWILALAGFCLILLQFFMIREVTALLRGTEIVILLVTVAYFLGYSVGYGTAGWFSFHRIRIAALVAWAVHLTLPFSFRYLGGWPSGRAAGLALVLLLFLTAFVLSSFYSVLLPRFIDQAADSSRSLVHYYGIELLGAVIGVAFLVAAGRHPWVAPVIYQAALAAVVALLWKRWFVWAVAGAGVVAYALAFSALDNRSLNFVYAAIQGMNGTQVLSSANTLYQKVDFVRDGDGRRHIFLSGRQNYGSTELSRFNVYLSRVPAKLARPQEALIIGSGSMESVGHVAEFARHVTTVELDAAVVEGSRRYLSDVNRLDKIRNWTLFINDGKEFLGSTQKRFDLIVMDVPAPATIQLGLLHSVEFYRLARQHLNPHGLISVSLCGAFATDDETPRSIVASLARAFDSVLAYMPTDCGRSLAVASQDLPFTPDELRSAVLEAGAPDVLIYAEPQIRALTADARPITADNMRIVLQQSWQHLADYYLREALE